ncbi:tripartite motif-containing protein 2-like [Saccostrea cucullata]|uniref:tripartite motif-containing protein 2-like n=1 Tax=Saccostrea cuccullata TaxID=36930 RepID=UPI002ED0901F
MTDVEDSSIASAQVLIKCHLCPNKVELFCTSCDINLCATCVGKHMLDVQLLKHDVIKYSLKFATFPMPFCQTHVEQKCDFHCQECDVSVCSKCISTKTHSQHKITDITKIFRIKEDIISNELFILEEQIIPECDRIISQIKRDILDLPKINKNLKSEISEQGQELHRALDKVINKRLVEIDENEKNDMSKLNNILSDFQDHLDAVYKAMKNNKELLCSRQGDVLNYKANVDKFMKLPSLPAVTSATFNRVNITEHNINSIVGQIILPSILYIEKFAFVSKLKEEPFVLHSYTKELLDMPVITAHVNTEYSQPFRISCLGNDQAWISGSSNVITRLDSKGSTLDNVKTKSGGFPRGLAVSNEGDLLYTDFYGKSINLVKNGREEILFNVEWNPSGICCSASGDILVALSNISAERKKFQVVRFSNGSLKPVIESVENQTLFKQEGVFACLHVAENKNGDICIVDWNAWSVLIFSKEGKLKSKYSGKAISHSQKKFEPRYATIDSQGHILVPDYHNNCIHILDMNGKFISALENCDLNNPNGISIDNKDRLWVLEEKGKLKIIEYMKDIC